MLAGICAGDKYLYTRTPARITEAWAVHPGEGSDGACRAADVYVREHRICLRSARSEPRSAAMRPSWLFRRGLIASKLALISDARAGVPAAKW